MSYARDAENIKKNEEAYGKFRDQNKYGTHKKDAVGLDQLKQDTTDQDGSRIGKFDQVGHQVGSGADELNYRMNNKGSVSMDDIKDINSFGGKADKDGVVKVQNGADYKAGGDNLWRDVQDMNETGNYKFDDDVTSWAQGKRNAWDKKKGEETAGKQAKQAAEKNDLDNRRNKARMAGEAFGSSEEQAQKNKADDERAKRLGPDEVKKLNDSRASEEGEREELKALVQKRKNGANLTCAERRRLKMEPGPNCGAANAKNKANTFQQNR